MQIEADSSAVQAGGSSQGQGYSEQRLDEQMREEIEQAEDNSGGGATELDVAAAAAAAAAQLTGSGSSCDDDEDRDGREEEEEEEEEQFAMGGTQVVEMGCTQLDAAALALQYDEDDAQVDGAAAGSDDEDGVSSVAEATRAAAWDGEDDGALTEEEPDLSQLKVAAGPAAGVSSADAEHVFEATQPDPAAVATALDMALGKAPMDEMEEMEEAYAESDAPLSGLGATQLEAAEVDETAAEGAGDTATDVPMHAAQMMEHGAVFEAAHARAGPSETEWAPTAAPCAPAPSPEWALAAPPAGAVPAPPPQAPAAAADENVPMQSAESDAPLSGLGATQPEAAEVDETAAEGAGDTATGVPMNAAEMMEHGASDEEGSTVLSQRYEVLASQRYDAKLANLIDQDFDPQLAHEALLRCEGNLDAARNELLNPWQTSGHEWIGRCVTRAHDGIEIDAWVTKWVPAFEDNPALWHVRHADDDEEDLEEDEMRAALEAFELRTMKRQAPSEARGQPPNKRLSPSRTHQHSPTELPPSSEAPPSAKAPEPSTSSVDDPPQTEAQERQQYIYGLATQAAAKKQKSAADPTDLQAVEAAAKKAAKDADAKLLFGLEPDYEVRTDSTAGTGLRNLGATCYLNSLLQTLFMIVGFRRGFYQWAATTDVVAGEAGAGSSGQPHPAEGAAAASAPASTDLPRSPEEVLLDDRICRELQLLFAHLQHSASVCYDPTPLVTALHLDPLKQQDPREFLDLLREKLEGVLKHSPEPSVQTLVQDHFRGSMTTETQCKTCKTVTESSSEPFYLLELNLRPTLQEALDELGTAWRLDGDNQYQCNRCGGKRDATSRTAIRQLPPVLCLHLKRFEFDYDTEEKTKKSDPIIFPELLDTHLDTHSLVFGPAGVGHQSPATYHLTAVVLHSGKDNAGHYTARILEQRRDGRWLTMDDQLVKEADFPKAIELTLTEAAIKAKRRKGATKPKDRQPGVTELEQRAPNDGRLFTSEEAYLLLYTREDELVAAKATHEAVEAPAAVREAVERANATLRADHAKYQDALRVLKARDVFNDELRPILRADGHDGRWIESRWLQACLTLGPRGTTDEPGPIRNQFIECCHGGAADPKHVSTGAMKLISVAAWQKLLGLFQGGPELLATGCVTCADAEWEKRQQEKDREALKTALASALKSASSSRPKKRAAVEANGGDGGVPRDDCYYVPRLFGSKWLRWLSEGQRDATRELFCPHGSLRPLETHAPRTIGAEAWRHLIALFPDSIAIPVEAVGRGDGDGRLVECAACLVSEGEREAAKEDERTSATLSAQSENAWRDAQRHRLGRLLQEDGGLDPHVLRSSRPFYLLDGTWIAKWRHAVQHSRTASMLGAPRGAECCTDHGRLLVRPELCVRNVMGHLSRSASSEARRGERGGSGGALRRREAERDKQLGARVCMVSEVEALELANGATMTDLTDLQLPSCELRDDGSFLCQPPVCEECSPKLERQVHDALLQYTGQQVHLKKLEALPTVDDASESTIGGARSSGGGGGGGGGGSVLDGSGPSYRRSTRASAGSTIRSILASSSINVLNLKLRILEATEWSPTQQRLFIDGDELLNDEQSLSDAGVLPNSFIHVYIDTSRVAELPTIEGAFGDADKTKTRPLEVGFANSALSSSFLSRA